MATFFKRISTVGQSSDLCTILALVNRGEISSYLQLQWEHRKQTLKKPMRLTFIIKRTLIGILLALMMIAVLAVGVMIWYYNRSIPPPVTDQALFQGITYTRLIKTDPVPQIIHIAKIDLTADGLSFLVTPSGNLDDFDYEAQSVSQFLNKHNLQLAINGDFFDPWRDYGIFNYYPHVGEGSNVRGLSVSHGDITTIGYALPQNYQTLYISRDNHASFSVPEGEIYNAISGNITILENGQIPQFDASPYLQKRHPRTAIGLTQDGNTLILVVIDGRQPNYSLGATLPEVAQILLDVGAFNAINLDGGGSSTMVIDDNGEPKVISSPIQSSVPTRERPIANHLGIYAQSLK